jgi:hypothetical protein
MIKILKTILATANFLYNIFVVAYFTKAFKYPIIKGEQYNLIFSVNLIPHHAKNQRTVITLKIYDTNYLKFIIIQGYGILDKHTISLMKDYLINNVIEIIYYTYPLIFIKYNIQFVKFQTKNMVKVEKIGKNIIIILYLSDE